MKTPEIVRIISELNEMDKAVQFLYEQCDMLKKECERLNQENSELKNKLAQSN
jgi:peptidoglycan hydrolase CwlO-like protein